MRRDITFPSQGVLCSGWLYVPDDRRGAAPAIVMANAISAVKEITLPGYAERFAAAGYVVLAFDYRHYGGSGGEPRSHLDPHEQQQDVSNAITWLRAQPEVDSALIGGWGISLGGVHMLHAGAYDRRLKAVVSVATGLNMLEQMMGRDNLLGFLAYLNADRDKRIHSGSAATYMPAVSLPGKGGAMALQEAYDLYTEAMNTYAPNYENRITLESMEYLVADHSAEAIELIAPTALLMIHGERDLIPPDVVRAAFERAGEPKKLIVLDCLHTDLYNREPWLTQSADAAIEWFDHYLHNRSRQPQAEYDAAAEQRNKQIMADFIAATNSGALGKLDNWVIPDYVEHDPIQGQRAGREGLKAAYAMFNSPFPDLEFRTEDVIGEGDLVIGRGVISGTHEGEFFGVPATHKKVVWTGTRLFRFENGRVTDGWVNLDMLRLMTQMGVIPAPAPPPLGPRNNLTGAPSTREANHQLMRDFVEELWNKGRLEWAEEHFHPEATSPNAPQLPPGAQGTNMIVQMMRAAFPDFHMEITHMIAEDDRVAARFVETGTHQGELFGVAPTGKQVRFTEIGILRVADGKIVESWYDVDMLGLMQQLGVGGS
jgi:predicted ester cyclase/dienelactone hydrolase